MPREEIKLYLGHVERDATAVYAPYDPSYLRTAAAAIDDYFVDLDKRTKRELIRRDLVAVSLQPTLPAAANDA